MRSTITRRFVAITCAFVFAASYFITAAYAVDPFANIERAQTGITPTVPTVDPALFLPVLAGGNATDPSTPGPMPTPDPDMTPSPIPPVPADEWLTAGPIAFPANFMQSVKEYGAVGDGVANDTAAIKAALADGRDKDQDYYGRQKMLYFPAGTYLVNDTIAWRGCCVLLQGQGSGATVIKLQDDAPGFGDPANPKPIIQTIKGNKGFRQSIWDLAVNTGTDNPGAVGIDYISNNTGSMRNVAVTSGDGQGVRGIDMTRAWPGPLLLKNISVDGFDYGIELRHAEYGPTFENIILRNQNVAGITHDNNTLAIHHLRSENSVPAIQTTKSGGHVVLLDAELTGGASDTAAIENAGRLYARNVATAGYASAVDGVAGTTLDEYLSSEPLSLFDDTPAARSLGLPIKETPVYNDTDLANWGEFTTKYYGDTSSLQDLLNSGKPTIYFPAGIYFSYNQRIVTVPASVKRIVGFGSLVNGDGKGTNGGGIRFVVAEASAEPLIIEQFGYGVTVEQTANRPVAIKNGGFRYTSTADAGDLFFEDVVLGYINGRQLVVQPGQNVWARQFNVESLSGGPRTKVDNNGGNLWILGIKTEGRGSVIVTGPGGQTELLGTLIYPLNIKDPGNPANDEPAFVSTDANVSYIYSVSVYATDGNYAIQIEETRNGETRRLTSEQTGRRIPLYVSGE